MLITPDFTMFASTVTQQVNNTLNNAAQNAQNTATTAGRAWSGAFGTVLQGAQLAGIQMGPLAQGVNVVTASTVALAQQWARLPSLVAQVGAAITTAGTAATVVGAAIVGIAGKQDTAQADLQSAIENTGGSYGDYSDKIDAAIAREEKHGHTAADTMEAISKLTVGIRDSGHAIADINTLEGLAAYKHETLTAASTQLSMALNGQSRTLRELGISAVNLPKLTQAAETADKAHAAAVDTLTQLQERQGQQAQMAAARNAAAAATALSNAKAVRDAAVNLEAAQDVFNKLIAGPTLLQIEEGYMGIFQAEKQATNSTQSLVDAQQAFNLLAAGPTQEQITQGYLNIARAAQATRDAQQKVIDLQKALDAILRPTADTQAKADEAVAKARIGQTRAGYTLADAEDSLAKMKRSGAYTSRMLHEAEIKVQEAKFGVTEAARVEHDAELALKKLRDDSLPGSKAATDATNALADAKLTVQEQTLRESQAGTANAKMYADALPGSKAYELAENKVSDAVLAVASSHIASEKATAAVVKLYADAKPGSDSYAAAEKRLKDAQDQVTLALERQANQGNAALSAGFAQESLQDQLAKAQQKVQDSALKATDAKQKLTDATGKNSVENQLNTMTHNYADRQANTYIGTLKNMWTKILDNIAANGAWGRALIQVGPLLMALGLIIQTGVISKVVSMAGAVVSGVNTVITAIGQMVYAGAVKTAAWIAQQAAQLAATVAANIGIIAATGGIIVGIMALLYGILYVAQHWTEIWNWIKDAVSTAWAWIKKHAELILVVFAPFILPFIEIAKHWSEIWAGVQNTFTSAWDGIKHVAGTIADFFRGVWDGIVGAIKWGINTEIDLFNNFIKGAVDLVNKGLGLLNKIPGLDKILPKSIDIPLIPKLAGGGFAMEGGVALVGEKGPELLQLAKGASVIPLSSTTASSTTSQVTIAAGAVQIRIEGNASSDTVAQLQVASVDIIERLADSLRGRGR